MVPRTKLARAANYTGGKPSQISQNPCLGRGNRQRMPAIYRAFGKGEKAQRTAESGVRYPQNQGGILLSATSRMTSLDFGVKRTPLSSRYPHLRLFLQQREEVIMLQETFECLRGAGYRTISGASRILKSAASPTSAIFLPYIPLPRHALSDEEKNKSIPRRIFASGIFAAWVAV